MKKLIVAVVLLAMLVPALVLAGCGGNKVPAGAIAAVGGGVVTQQQFDAIWAQAEAQYKNHGGRAGVPQGGHAAVRPAQGEHRQLPGAERGHQAAGRQAGRRP